MKWGIRKQEIEGVSNRTSRMARKDAAEYTRAKLFYGDGAGTRRKLIKAKVESRAKKDPSYKKAFDHHVENTDLGKRASQAKGERKRKDISASVGKTARGVKNLALQTGAPVTLAALGIYYASQNPKVRSTIVNASKVAFSKIEDGRAAIRTAIFFKKFGVKIP
jgi:hypothetical protein